MIYLNGIVHCQRKTWKIFFLTTRFVRCVHHGWHDTIRYASSCHTHESICVHRYPVSVHCLYHAGTVLPVGGSFAYFARNARCTVTADLLEWYSNTQNDFSPRSDHFLNIYTHIAWWQKCELQNDFSPRSVHFLTTYTHIA